MAAQSCSTSHSPIQSLDSPKPTLLFQLLHQDLSCLSCKSQTCGSLVLTRKLETCTLRELRPASSGASDCRAALMRYRLVRGRRSADHYGAATVGAGLIPLRPESGTCSHHVGLLFAHWPDFGCLLSHNSPLANSNSWDWGQMFAKSDRANSDLGGSILAQKTLT